jgi:competence protein ComEC
VAVPLCGLVLVSNLAALLAAGWFPGAAECFNHAGWFLMECIRVSSHWFAGWPGAYYYVAEPGILGTVLYYALLLAAATGWLFRPKVRSWATAAFGMAAGCWCWQTWQTASITRLTVLPLSGGHAIYFDAPGRRNDLLVDCGSSNSVQLLTKPFLRAQGVNRLPGLVLTHGNSQSIGGAQAVDALFPARAIWASSVRFRSAAYRRALQEFNRTPGKLHTVSRGDRLGPWTILHPEAGDRLPQADDNALVLMGELQGARVLLLCGLGRPGQNALLGRKDDLRADIVITGLPVATEAIGEELLEAVQPRVIIVADSEFPASARASPRLRERLAQRNIPVLYTRSEGAVTLELRGGRWELRTMSGVRLASTARMVSLK